MSFIFYAILLLPVKNTDSRMIYLGSTDYRVIIILLPNLK